jgi:hypothetical protein
VQARDISFQSTDPNALNGLAALPLVNGHTAFASPVRMAPAIGMMQPALASPAALPFASPQTAAPTASTSTIAAFANAETPLAPIPTERITAPITRTPEEEAAAREFVSSNLREARQYSGSRPSPLTQIDRLIARVRLFATLHAQHHFGPQNQTIYWSDLLKFGGMGTVRPTCCLVLASTARVQAWNEKKAGRRAYKHIYADLLQHQTHPSIAPLLDDERGKSIEHLESALDAVYGRPSKPSTPGAAVASGSGAKKDAAAAKDKEEPPEDALLELAENDQLAVVGPSGKKRKREHGDAVRARHVRATGPDPPHDSPWRRPRSSPSPLRA